MNKVILSKGIEIFTGGGKQNFIETDCKTYQTELFL